MRPLRLFACALSLTTAGCASSAASSAVATSVAGSNGCRAAARRAAAEPTLAVDVMPQPVRQEPPILRGPFPAGVIKNGYAEVHASVVVDTLGRPLMKTFKVERTSHPWLGENVRNGIRQWRFSPAELGGCKVPRVYRVDAKAGGK